MPSAYAQIMRIIPPISALIHSQPRSDTCRHLPTSPTRPTVRCWSDRRIWHGPAVVAQDGPDPTDTAARWPTTRRSDCDYLATRRWPSATFRVFRVLSAHFLRFCLSTPLGAIQRAAAKPCRAGGVGGWTGTARVRGVGVVWGYRVYVDRHPCACARVGARANASGRIAGWCFRKGIQLGVPN